MAGLRRARIYDWCRANKGCVGKEKEFVVSVEDYLNIDSNIRQRIDFAKCNIAESMKNKKRIKITIV